MNSKFRYNGQGRVPFAVISVIILISASVMGAYVYTLSQNELKEPNLPVSDFENIRQDISSNLDDIATDSLQVALSVYGAALSSDGMNISTSKTMDLYCENASNMFENRMLEKYPGNSTQGDFDVNVQMISSDNNSYIVTPIYTDLYAQTEVGNGPGQVPRGFILNTTIGLYAVDTNTRARFIDTILVHSNISTYMPAVLEIMASMDISNLDNVLSNMVGAVMFAKLYGTWSHNMGMNLTCVPKPNQTLSEPAIDIEEKYVQGFGSDIGPVPTETLMSSTDLEIIRDLAFILLQVRYFGMWDDVFVDSFLAKVHSYSLIDEGRLLGYTGLRAMIGEASPNFVNCEALVLELFHEMGRVPVDINIVLPLLEKMMDEGFMGLFNSDFETWMKGHLASPTIDTKDMFKAGGWFDASWLAKDTFLLGSYGVVLEEFMSMVLGFILRAYHIDNENEVKSFVTQVLNQDIEGTVVKKVPDKIEIPPGRPLFTLYPKADVQRKTMKRLDTILNTLYLTNIMGIKFNGYTWVYLFMMSYDRPTYNDTIMQARYNEIYNNWTNRAKDFVVGKNLSALTRAVNKTDSDFETVRANETAILNDLYKTDLSSNLTLNNSLGKAISVLHCLSENYSKASSLMNGSSRFFIYNQGGETSNWNDLQTINHNLDKLTAQLDSIHEDFNNYTRTMNISSPLYDTVANVSIDIMNADFYGVDDAYRLIDGQLNTKWIRDVLADVQDKLKGLDPSNTSAGTLYTCIGLLSDNIVPHPNLGFIGTIDELSNEIANISSESKGLTFNVNGTKRDESINEIVYDKQGIDGIVKLLGRNLNDIRTTFVDTIGKVSNIELIGNKTGWASHKTYDLASARLLNGSYADSMADLLMEKAVLSAEEAKYSNPTPISLWQNKSDFKVYGEKSYLDLELYVLDALIQKLGDLQQIFEATEVHPGMAATFGGIRIDKPNGPTPLSNLTLTYDGPVSSTKWKGLRVFENTSSVAPEDVFLQYLNPFSTEWFDYYLTNSLYEGSGRLNILLGFNETVGSRAGIGPKTMHAGLDYPINYSTTISSPTPLPATTIDYSPTASFFKRLNSVELDRNVFSKACNKAHVNFTFEGAGGNFKNDTFKVQVKAIVRSLSSSLVIGVARAVQALMTREDSSMERDLTGVVDVADNDKNDLDPRDGHVSVLVSFNLDNLKIQLGSLTFYDSQPILQVMVWKTSSFKALMSEALLESVTGNFQLYSIAPTIQVNEQGFFYFDGTKDPVLGVYDVGEGDKEVKVPLEIYLEDLTSLPLMTFDINKILKGDISTLAFPRDDPRTGSVYKLTCNFTIIRKIPTDSAVVINKNVPLLVDFDDGHGWLRDMHLNLIMFEKGIGDVEETILNALLPRTIWEKEYVTLLPASEYKFALTYNFIPIYMQYFNGYLPPPSNDDIANGMDYVIPLGLSENPDLYHIAYRVVPMNINRGKIAITLWYELITELLQHNYTLNLFIYDIVGTVVRELGDIIDEVQLIKGATELLDKYNGPLELLKMVRLYLKYWKNIQDILKILPAYMRPWQVKLSTPGAKVGLDWGNNYYLGFDIGTNLTNNEAYLQTLKMTTIMEIMGFLYDVKTIVKMLNEIIGLLGFKGRSGEFDSNELTDSMKKIVDNTDTYTSIATKENALLNPAGGKSADQFAPASLFMVQKKYNMTDAQLKENGATAHKLGYSIIDVSIMRHRNGFTADDMTNMHDGFGVDQYGFHGLTCVVDIDNIHYRSLLSDKNVIKIGYANICEYGTRATYSDWMNISQALDSGVPMDAINISAKISLPYDLLLKCEELGIDPVNFTQKAEALTDILGHENLFEYLGQNPDRLCLIDAAYEFKDIASIFLPPSLMLDPLRVIWPDIYFNGRLFYVYSLSPKASTDKDARDLVNYAQRDALNRTNKTCYVFYDISYSKMMTDAKFSDAIVDRTLPNDRTGRIGYQFVYSQDNYTDEYIHNKNGVFPMPFLPNDIP